MRRQTVVAAVAAMAFGAMAGSAQAALVNPSFESADLTGWTLVSSGGYGAGATVVDNVADQSNTYPRFSNPLPGTAADTHFVQLAGNSGNLSYLYQDLGLLQANTTYTLTVAIGASAFDYNADPGTISLINGTSQLGTVLSSADAASLGFGHYANSFKDLTTIFTTGGIVAGNLVVAIGGDGFPNNAMNVDNVRLTEAAVPEPASLALLGLGGISLLGGRRRQV